MNIFQLECFLALSHSLNFTLTSEEMFITQPTLSRNIASLEQEIGMQLLIRNTKSVELTAAGETFAKRAAKMLEEYNRGIEEAKQARDGVTGKLRLGIQQDAFEPFIVDLIHIFQAKHPDIQLQLCPMSMSKLIQALDQGELDAIIAAGQPGLKNPGKMLLFERQECAVLPNEHPLALRESVLMEELKNERFVAMSPAASTSGHYLLLKYASDAGFAPNIVSLVDSVPAVMMQVACGVGIAVLYKDLSINSHDRLRFVPLKGVDTFKRWLMWDMDSHNPALDAIISTANEFSSKSLLSKKAFEE